MLLSRLARHRIPSVLGKALTIRSPVVQCTQTWGRLQRRNGSTSGKGAGGGEFRDGNSNSNNAFAAGAVGLGAGTLGACAGVGGAIFVIPGLMRFTGLSQRVAAGNSLIAVTCVSATSAVSFAQKDHVDWQYAGVLTAAASVASPIGAYLSRLVNKNFLRKTLGVLVMAVAPLMPVRSKLLKQRAEKEQLRTEISESTAEKGQKTEDGKNVKMGVLAVAGSSIGFCSGMLGVGGGNFFTGTIAVTSDMPLKSVLGTSLAAMALPSAIASATYFRLGQVNLRLVPPLMIGCVAGASIGSKLALAAPENVLQYVFAVVFAILGFRMFRAPLRAPLPPNASNFGVKKTTTCKSVRGRAE